VSRMHLDEVDTDAALVRRLIAQQFPRWMDLPITSVASAGTDNAMYRLGDDLAAPGSRVRSAKSTRTPAAYPGWPVTCR
jgi:aminoglycoside phosphotransferase (APT) family kinase protein